MIFLYKLCTQLGLIARIFVVHVEDLGFRPDVLRGVAVAIDAPVHIQSVDFINPGHFVDLAMAG